MDEVVFIGDEMTAVAYALAGVTTRTLEPGATAVALDACAVQGEVKLVLLGALHAQALGRDELARRMRLGAPPLMVVGDAAGAGSLPDFAALLRRRLGVAV